MILINNSKCNTCRYLWSLGYQYDNSQVISEDIAYFCTYPQNHFPITVTYHICTMYKKKEGATE